MKKVIGAILVVALGALLVFGAWQYKEKKDDKKDAVSTSESSKIQTDLGKKITLDDYKIDELVTLGKFENLNVEVKYEDITEEKLTSYIEQLLGNYPSYTKNSKLKVEDKDIVNIDYVGTIDGKEFEGGKAAGTNLVIGSNTFIDGFEKQLIDQKVGETVAVKVTFPKDYKDATLQNKKAVFEVKINGIMDKKILKPAEMDDTFVNQNFGFNTVAEFKEDVKKYLLENNESSKTSNTRAAVVDKVIKESAITLPKKLLESQVAHYLNDFKKSVDGAGYKYDDYLMAQYQVDAATYAKNIKQAMEQKLKEQIVLTAVAEKVKIELDQDGYNAYLKQFLDAYDYSSEKQLYAAYPKTEMERAYICNKAVEYLISKSTIKYVADAK